MPRARCWTAAQFVSDTTGGLTFTEQQLLIAEFEFGAIRAVAQLKDLIQAFDCQSQAVGSRYGAVRLVGLGS